MKKETFKIGNYYPKQGGCFICSSRNNDKMAYYFLAPKKFEKRLYYGILDFTGMPIVEYNDIKTKHNESLDGCYLTQKFLIQDVQSAGKYCLDIGFSPEPEMLFDDYFLPSIQELYDICLKRDEFNQNCPENEQLEHSFYWSANESAQIYAYMVWMGQKSISKNNKNIQAWVRPVRKWVK